MEGFSAVTAVILNYNRRDDTLACLRSLIENEYPCLTLLVLDNGSSDGSVEAVEAQYPQAKIIRLPTNLGYAGNNNVGIREALQNGADWVLLLNDDTLLSPTGLKLMVAAGESEPRVGIVGPMVYHYSEPQIIQSAGGSSDRLFNFRHTGQNEEDRGQYGLPRRVDWVTGCALLVRRQVFEQIGFFDEQFFMYAEEADLAFRARQAGWEILFEPRAHLWHKGVQRDYKPGSNVVYYSTRNHLILLKKHGAPLKAKLGFWLKIIRIITSYTLRPKWKDRQEHRDAFLQGLLDFVKGVTGKRPAA